MKKLIAVFVLFSLVTVLLVACSGGSDAGNVNGPAVHMNDTNFVQPWLLRGVVKESMTR